MDRPRRTHGRGLSGPLDLTHPTLLGALARCSFPTAGTVVDCAVSGGADSLALLVLAVAAGCEPTAHHVDHGLRDGSAAEAGVVRAVAERLGAGFRAHRVEVSTGPDLEARARVARFAALPDGVLTGHTADDRAETVLLHLLRGAGPAGAVGIARSARRPLLDLRRADTVGICAALGLDPVDDPSNRDPRFRRNRVRHEVLPLLADVAERDPVPILVRQADLFADVDAALRAEASMLDPTSARALSSAPRAVAGAAVRAWLVDVGIGDGYAVDAGAVDRVLSVARGEHRATEVAGGWRVSRTAGRLSVAPPSTWQDARHG